jgi:hypothetical protein
VGQKPRSRTIKVSDREYHLIQRARRELERHGYADLEDEFGGVLEKQDKGGTDELEKLLAGLALGAIAAVGAAALIKLLDDDE